MHLAVKHQTVPHLKSLNSDLDPRLAVGVAQILWTPCLLKKVILYHREANERFSMMSIVQESKDVKG